MCPQWTPVCLCSCAVLVACTSRSGDTLTGSRVGRPDTPRIRWFRDIFRLFRNIFRWFRDILRCFWNIFRWFRNIFRCRCFRYHLSLFAGACCVCAHRFFWCPPPPPQLQAGDKEEGMSSGWWRGSASPPLSHFAISLPPPTEHPLRLLFEVICL